MQWIKVSSKPPEEGFGTGKGNNDIHFKTYLGNRIQYSTWWLTPNDTITFNQVAPRPAQVLSRDSVYWLDETSGKESI